MPTAMSMVTCAVYRNLLDCLAEVPESQRRHGIRHRAAVVIVFAVAAVLADAPDHRSPRSHVPKMTTALGQGLVTPGQGL